MSAARFMADTLRYVEERWTKEGLVLYENSLLRSERRTYVVVVKNVTTRPLPRMHDVCCPMFGLWLLAQALVDIVRTDAAPQRHWYLLSNVCCQVVVSILTHQLVNLCYLAYLT